MGFTRVKISKLLSLMILAILPAVQATSLLSEQTRFLQAEKALRSGSLVRYHQLKDELENYPLVPYLEYTEASKNLSVSKKIEHFLRNNSDTYLASKLRFRWLKWLGKHKRWKQYHSIYQTSDSTQLQCYHLRAAIHQKHAKEIVDEALALWMTGKSQPDECDPAFEYLYKHKLISKETRWQRIGLAMDNGNLSLAHHLAKKLPSAWKVNFKQWIKVHKAPLKGLSVVKKWRDRPRNRDLLIHGVKRYGRNDIKEAWDLWRSELKPRFKFSDEQTYEVERSLVLRAAWQHLPEAADWFKHVPSGVFNQETREWRIRTAIRAENWQAVIKYINGLPKQERNSEEWRYWHARALAATGKSVAAKLIYTRLAKHTSYYGFQASEKLGRNYTFTNEPVIDEKAARKVKLLTQTAAFLRIHELAKIGRADDARREWRYEINRMSTKEKRVAARLAHNWEWHFTAIVTTAQAGHFADLDLRFPLLYQDEITKEAKRQSLNPSFVYGVIRRESAFRESAVSPAGALGLMQVMPRTARMMSKKLGMRRLSHTQIKTVQYNIKLGSRYLREVLDKYDNHEILATASYNAGPHRVKKWLPEDTVLPADIWVDSITFDETRGYVKAVLFYSTIFDWKLDNKVDHTLEQRMRPIMPIGQLTLTESTR
jgi:soluble lytic murein transglycosylase